MMTTRKERRWMKAILSVANEPLPSLPWARANRPARAAGQAPARRSPAIRRR